MSLTYIIVSGKTLNNIIQVEIYIQSLICR